MADIPAICTTCHSVFPAGFSITNASATFQNCRSRCSFCGGWATIPDGTYTVTEDTISFGPFTGISRKQFETILAIVLYKTNIQQPAASTAEIDNEIQQLTGEREFLRRIGDWILTAPPTEYLKLIGWCLLAAFGPGAVSDLGKSVTQKFDNAAPQQQQTQQPQVQRTPIAEAVRRLGRERNQSTPRTSLSRAKKDDLKPD